MKKVILNNRIKEYTEKRYEFIKSLYNKKVGKASDYSGKDYVHWFTNEFIKSESSYWILKNKNQYPGYVVKYASDNPRVQYVLWISNIKMVEEILNQKPLLGKRLKKAKEIEKEIIDAEKKLEDIRIQLLCDGRIDNIMSTLKPEFFEHFYVKENVIYYITNAEKLKLGNIWNYVETLLNKSGRLYHKSYYGSFLRELEIKGAA